MVVENIEAGAVAAGFFDVGTLWSYVDSALVLGKESVDVLSDPALWSGVEQHLKQYMGDQITEKIVTYTLPVLSVLVWTLVVYLVAHYRGRRSKENVLEGEMMKTQSALFHIEKDLTSYDLTVRTATSRRSSWNTRMGLLLLLVEGILSAYYYQFHTTSAFPSIRPQVQYLPLLVVPVW